jgi:aryl-alcohol dehydrogenase-like predicted oxidoreductase
MKLAIGTAQFGLHYGVANAGGQVSPEQAACILYEARLAGIDTLDTAIAYGNSEQRLGELGAQDWKVISKIPALPESVEHVGDWVMQQVRGSLQRIGVKQLDGLLMHQPSDILGHHGVAYVRALRQIRDEGLAKSIGYSIYSTDELNQLIGVLMPDIVQAPYNIVDRRLVTTGWLEKLADKSVRIHTRSVFLQGLLLMPDELRPSWFHRWQPLWEAWSEACAQSELSPLELSLGYVLAQASIERVVIGVDNLKHMKQIINAARRPVAELFPQIESEDLELIEPSRWEFR